MEANFSTWNLFKLASFGKFGFSRPDLDGNMLAKGIYLREKPVIEKCYLVVPRVVVFEIKSALKGLKLKSGCFFLRFKGQVVFVFVLRGS